MANKIKIGDLVRLSCFGINGMVIGHDKKGFAKISFFGSGKIVSINPTALTHLKGGK